ncbi:Glycosyl hydrolase family 3 C-terminal domain-containing protein 1 [Elsinoe fawcettii]|nr:Glycosyl hydrolase family 3 C-terminal domain-containing protein 1 [Elsinoe fawcettii]
MLHNPLTDSRTAVLRLQNSDLPYTFQDAVTAIRQGQKVCRAVHNLQSSLTKKEKLGLLDGDVPFWKGLRTILCDRYNREPFVHGTVDRLGIPGIRFTDGPRGIVMGNSTTFPVSMSRGATWDVALERRIGHAIGLEGRAQGANYFAGICVNLPRHPAWGRIQETYSEDPLLLGEFGVALNKGVQPHLMTCVKHFALNSMENARFKVDVKVDDAALHEVYLPHFRRLVEAGVDSVMSSYNSVQGEYAGQNEKLLTHILRDQWRFNGFVLSDFIFGLRDPALSLRNGLDIEAPFRQQRATSLEAALESGDLEWLDVDRACSRILRKQLEYVTKVSDTSPDASVVFCDEHRNLAREAAARGMVLLKNEEVDGHPILPVKASQLSKVAVVGRLANAANTGDRGSSAVFSPHVVTAYEGLRAALPGVEVILEDTDSIQRAKAIAEIVDLIICIVGYDAADEGEYVVPSFQENPDLLKLLPPAVTDEEKEVLAMVKGERTRKEREQDVTDDGLIPGAGGDRKSLRLRSRDVEIISAVSNVNKHTVVSVVAAGAIVMEDFIGQVPALLMSWYAGTEGGHALADILLGRMDTSGRLPFSIPTSEDHLPSYDIDTTSIAYDRYFGQRLLDKLGVSARYPLGFGLSYTRFTISGLKVDTSRLKYGETMDINVTVSNIGERSGRHIVQVYGSVAVEDFPSRVLLGFKPVDLTDGESRRISIQSSVRPLQRWADGRFSLASRRVTIELSAFSGDPERLVAAIEL